MTVSVVEADFLQYYQSAISLELKVTLKTQVILVCA